MQRISRCVVVLLVCLALLCSARPARAETLHTAAVQIVVGIVLVSAAVAVGVVLLVTHKPTVKGCAERTPEGLQLTGEDGERYLLTGDTAEIKPGDRVRISGKKAKGTGSPRNFTVLKAKDYGPCPVP